MSSTNRSGQHFSERKEVSDYYVTPINKIEDFLKEFITYESVEKNIKILDPCAGGDNLHSMSYPLAIKNILHMDTDTIDIREDSLAKIKADYLAYDLRNKYNIIITNPPFFLARQIIEKALNDVQDNGFVIMLLRLNFLEGKNRKDLYEKHLPKYVFVHHKRMSFTDDKKTDSIAYAHFVWQKGLTPEFTQLRVI